MAEFKTVVKEYQRMCHAINVCSKCPLSKYEIGSNVGTCDYILIENFEETEKIVMDWAKANPFMTNRRKFKDTFGFDYEDKFNASEKMEKWLKEEYKKNDFQF